MFKDSKQGYVKNLNWQIVKSFGEFGRNYFYFIKLVFTGHIEYYVSVFVLKGYSVWYYK